MTARMSAALGLALLLTVPPAVAADPVSFRRDVAPILVTHCLGCHNEAKSAFGLNMATFALLKQGGKGAGPDVLVPGDPDASELVTSVRADASPRMPYKLPPLSDRAIKTLETWVAEGAKFDGPSESDTRIATLHDPLAGLAKVEPGPRATAPVTASAFSPDGGRLAIAVGSEVRVFDAATVKLVATFSDHPGPLSAVAFTPDGKSVVTAGGRPGMFGAVTVWDLATGSKVREFRGHADTIQGAAVSPDGASLATASYDRTVILWDLAGGNPVRSLLDHTDAVYAVAFSADGKRLATAGADRTVKLWDPADGKKLKTLGDSTAELYAVAFSADGKSVLAAGVDRSIRAWDAEGSGTDLTGSVFAHDGAVLRLIVSKDGKRLVSSGEDRGVKLWALPELRPVAAIAGQSDWPQAVALNPEGTRLTVGRHDGSAELFDPSTGGAVAAVGEAAAVKAEKPEPPALVRNASLGAPSPRGAARGSKVRVTLSGNGVGAATEVLLPESGLTATVLPKEKADPNRLDVELAVAPGARVGLHRVSVVTPLGVPGFQTFAVEAHAAVAEAEPNDDPKKATASAVPATLTGTIDKPGDVDHFRIDAEAGRSLVVRANAKGLGSGLLAGLAVLDESGEVLAEKFVEEGTRDPVLWLTPERDGPLTLRVTDADFGGSGGHFYRVSVAHDPLVTGVFPLGVRRGGTTDLAVGGLNLGGLKTYTVGAAESAEPGALVEVPRPGPDLADTVNRRKVVVAEGPQSAEVEPNDSPERAVATAVPGGVSGRIDRPGDADHFKFPARKGERLIVEVFGRRLGGPIDPFLEILDAGGAPVPRALLRPITDTEVAFRDHNASGSGVRLTRWNNLAMNDVVLFGREVARIFALPKNPDDDCQFWSDRGQRLGLLETTPEHHPMGQPIYKVEVHPPGTTFPAGGVPPTTIYFRNDDGGPSFDKDARVTFDPPADGEYVARVTDARGQGSPDHAYHLVVRAPQPDYQLTVSNENPNVHRGGTLLVPVSVAREDGFEDAVEVVAEGLPPGVKGTPAVIERGAFNALMALTADPTAPAYSPATWTVRGRSIAPEGGSPGQSLTKEVDPGGPTGGRITVIPGPNLTVTPDPDRVTIAPGREVTMRLRVDRGPAFKGRVPIDVRNLPHGVRVLNIGLNGVLVTETQTERTVTLYAEPWVSPMTRPFYAVGKAESAGTEHSTGPITLVVAPGPPATASVSQEAGAGRAP